MVSALGLGKPNVINRHVSLLVKLTLLITVPVILLGIYTFKTQHDILTKIALERRVSLAKLGAASIEERMNRLLELAIHYSQHDNVISAIEAGKWDEAITELMVAPTASKMVDRVFLSDIKGIEKAAFPNDPSVIGRDFSDREWYKGVSAQWKPYVTGIYQRAAAPRINVIAIAIPVFSKNNAKEPVAIIVVQVPATTFNDIAATVEGDEGYLYLVDKNGNLVVHPNYETDKEIINIKDSPPVQKALAGMSGYLQFYNTKEHDERLSAFWPISDFGWGVVMTEPVSSVFSERNQGLWRVVIVWSLVTLISTMMGLIIYRFVVILANQREREHSIFEALGEGLIVVNAKGIITQVNAAMEKIGGFMAYELLGRHAPSILNLYDKDGKAIPEQLRPFSTVFSTRRPYSIEVLLKNKLGKTVPISVVATPIASNGIVVGAVAVVSDITDRYLLEKAKDEFIVTAAHQLNSPLGQIRWSLDLLVKKYAIKLPKAAKDILDDAHESTMSLAALVNDLLVASRITQDKIQSHPVPFSPVTELKFILKSLAPQIKEKKLIIESKTFGEVPHLILDKLSFSQVFENILRNAIKYSHTKGQIVISLQKIGEFLQVSVSDEGIGIPQKDMDSIFSKFFRASNVDKAGISGTGLGLFVVRSYAEHWGGRVWIESQEGKGTTVFVKIPLPKL